MSKSTFRGTLVFVALLIIVFIFPDLFANYTFNDTASWSIYSSREKELKEHVATSYHERKTKPFPQKSRYRKPQSKFNPNDFSLKDWMGLGLSKKQASVILKFSKYGIKSNEQLKRIFVISDELYELLKDSTYYPEVSELKFEQHRKDPIVEYNKKIVVLELNSADETALIDLPGIGEFFARNILKKREELGGFVNKEQLLEVWKMDEVKLNQLSKYIEVDPKLIQKIEINFASASELNKHPYITWNLANSIVKLRLQNGSFSQIEDIKKSLLVTDELFEKLKPYLQITK